MRRLVIISFIGCLIILVTLATAFFYSVPSQGPHNPLTVAAREGDLKRTEQLLREGASINACDPDGMTALVWALSRKQREVAKFLIDNALM
jgi:ankyrin repeat protein